jgi:ribosome production factor 2
MVSPRVDKPKTKRGKRFLEGREPLVVENVKKAMFIKGGRTNEAVTTALKQFYMLKKPFSLLLSKNNILRPFEDVTPLEYLTQKNDHSLFMFGFNSKKRPNSLILGRFFDQHVTDMFELGIEKLLPMANFQTPKITLGIKPCLIFHGEPFEIDPEFQRLKCLLTDFFRGEVVDNVRLQGIEHALHFTAAEGKLYIRSYRVMLKKSATKVPNVELVEMGPSLDVSVRRSKLCSDDVYNRSKKQPKEIEPKKKKNVSVDAFGSILGRVHMEKQDLSKLQLRKVKALKRSAAADGEKVQKNKKSKQEDVSTSEINS